MPIRYRGNQRLNRWRQCLQGLFGRIDRRNDGTIAGCQDGAELREQPELRLCQRRNGTPRVWFVEIAFANGSVEIPHYADTRRTQISRNALRRREEFPSLEKFEVRHRRLERPQRCGRHGGRPATRETAQIQRTAGLGAGPREPLAPEWLHADDRTDGIAIDVDVTRADAISDVGNRLVDPGVQAESEAVARGIDGVEQILQLIPPVA